MRSPKQRSRSKQNRPRTLGNIINRVFDSSGPEGKVRGTPQQIIEKYQVLARDAQLSNDRVAAENFQQHAEHYTRMLAQATREMQAEADARRLAHEESQNRNRQQHEDRAQRYQNGQHPQQPRRADEQPEPAADALATDVPAQDAFALVEQDSTEDVALVETPEAPAAPVAAQPEARNRPARPEGARRDGPRRDASRRDGVQPDAKPQAALPPQPEASAPADPSADAKPRRNQRRARKPAEDAARAAE